MQYHRDCVGNDRSTSMPLCIYLYNMHRRVQTCALQVNTYTYGLSECMWDYVPNHLHSHTYHSDPCAPSLCFLMLSISKSAWSVSSFATHGPWATFFPRHRQAASQEHPTEGSAQTNFFIWLLVDVLLQEALAKVHLCFFFRGVLQNVKGWESLHFNGVKDVVLIFIFPIIMDAGPWGSNCGSTPRLWEISKSQFNWAPLSRWLHKYITMARA